MQDMPPSPYASPAGSPYPPQMNYQPQARTEGHVALKYGFIAGAIIAVITLLVFFLFLIPGMSDAFNKVFPQTIPGIYFTLASIVISLLVALLNTPVYFCLGLFASRRTGKLETAMLACIWALLCFLFADICTYIISFFMYLPLGTASVIPLTLLDYGISLMIDLFLALVFGFGVAILGAVIGKPGAR